ncbi:MAG: hypothetical protein LBQ30_03335 [Treponema sp.]|jgi:hypothetical protein|nr:hypothetical protein [Treponema sp.]
MKTIVPLDELLKQYIQGTLLRKDFEGRIFTFVLENRQRFHLFDWGKDTCVDFLCWLYPRMSRAIDNYQEMGSSFEAYMASIVYWSAREYRSREVNHNIIEHAFWEARAEDMHPCESEPDYLEPLPALKPVTNPRQTLILSLKSYFFMSEDYISRIAPAIGIAKEQLQYLIDEVRKRRIARDEEIRGLRERIQDQYYRCMVFEKKLEATPKESCRYEKIKGQLERARTRYRTMKKRYASMSRHATNREIAEVLGLSKGAVDSSLYAIKQKAREQLRPQRDL